ncbi:hypothetical protein SAMN05880501_10248 [Ureibacillus xyleni]|uniref:Uncharacterized protein n=1 Tax=Ureibacillus xyleni TaxID=614648 RepID=A0A285RWX4_9BACL|nr:hypothetical protein [Ureibacillus xyleni]SOB98566.1 hypothetical protein SAMN05880501_10248 [Ureibacillus xyleni]
MKKLLVGTAFTATLLLGAVGQTEAASIPTNVEKINVPNFDFAESKLISQSRELKVQINNQVNVISETNKKISNLDEALKLLNALNKYNSISDEDLRVYLVKINSCYEASEFGDAYNLKSNENVKDLKNKIEADIVDIKSQLDILNAKNQIDMLHLSALNYEYNQVFEQLQQLSKKHIDSRSVILGEFR